MVIILTLATMAVEIVAGLVYGSMALLADGWHMASHAAALSITALAYYLSRKHRRNTRFTFGTGKIGDLGGYTSALLLALVAMLMVHESVERLIHPVSIRFDQALLVAVIGLVVNLVSAVLLKEDHGHDHHGHSHHEGQDQNLRAAYMHVLADALTSILAILALLAGKMRGWVFLDPMMGIVGALVIAKWSYGLLLNTGQSLLDYNQDRGVQEAVEREIRAMEGLEILDLHVWKLGPGHFGAIVAVSASGHCSPDEIRARLADVPGLSHLTVEINCPAAGSGRA
jgi:cation diffusion facilitator family transporter